MRKFFTIGCLLAILSVFMIGTVIAQTQIQATATWTAPTEGSPVDHYVVELSVDGGEYINAGMTPTTSITLNLDVLQEYVVRVAGVDALDRQGPWSLPSEPYVPDPGAPTAPGQPTITVN